MDTYFELSDSGNSVIIELLGFRWNSPESDWDKNWLETKVIVKAGSFLGEYCAEFMTIDFREFKKVFQTLYDDLSGRAVFDDLEGYLKISITGDGIGHFEADVKACDRIGIDGNRLTFSINFDQTYIKPLIRQLDKILKEFPVKGDLK